MNIKLIGGANCTFDIASCGGIPAFDPEAVTCILDIYSNFDIDWKGVGFANVTGAGGNYSKWVDLDMGECAAVTGMSSCGGVIVANRDLSKVAAAHVGGHINYEKEGNEKKWCDTLLNEYAKFEPGHLLVAGGTQGDLNGPARVLELFRTHLGIESTHAFSISSCQDMLLARVGSGVGYASYKGEIPFQRQGQAIRNKPSTSQSDGTSVQDFGTLESMQTFDETIGEHYTLVCFIASYGANKIIPAMGDDAKEQAILKSGKTVIQEYYNKLTLNLKIRFQNFNIFKTFPGLWQ